MGYGLTSTSKCLKQGSEICSLGRFFLHKKQARLFNVEASILAPVDTILPGLYCTDIVSLNCRAWYVSQCFMVSVCFTP